jgi:hypothetical protein
MHQITEVKKTDNEEPVPTVWRSTFAQIVEAFIVGDFALDREIEYVSSLSEADARRISRNISNYGEKFVSLSEDTWNTSVCRWTGCHWDAFVDLATEAGTSDLVMFSRVKEEGGRYSFVVDSVHVP